MQVMFFNQCNGQLDRKDQTKFLDQTDYLNHQFTDQKSLD